jgi:hypothetical protein
MHPRDRRYRMLFAAMTILMAAALACNQLSVPAPTTPGPTHSVSQATVTPLVPLAPTPLPSTPTETPPSGSGPGGCLLSAQYIADVTIPDNTAMTPGSAFVKTWRVKNSGTCSWEAGYQLVFAEGNQMGGPAGASVNDTPVGSTVDISVNLTAPSAPGTHIGKWRLRANNGAIFGALTVVIVIPSTPTPTPTATSAPITPSPTPTSTTASGLWNGQWETNCGSSNCGAMDLVQTGNIVTGRYAIDTSTPGTINATVSGNRLSGEWSRSGSSGAFDWWMGGSGVKWRGNFGSVYSWCGHRAGESDPSPCGVGTFNGNWMAVCAGCNGAMQIVQDGKDFAGTYVNGTFSGTIDGVKATGTWQTGSNSGSLTWHLINSKQFNGNYDGGSKWCGYKSGSSEPSPCLR